MPPASTRKLERGQVLIFDEESEEAERLCAALRPFVSVHVCSKPAEVQARLRAAHYLAVIAAHEMPGTSGLEVLTTVAQRSPDTLRILVCQPRSAGALAAAFNGGCVDHAFCKPLELDGIVQLISRATVRSSTPAGPRAVVIGDQGTTGIGALLESAGFVVDHARSLESSTPWASQLGTPVEVVLWEPDSPAGASDRLAKIRATFGDAAVVCIERSGDIARAGALLADGADDVVLRPLQEAELGARVRRAVERRRLLAEAHHARRAAAPAGLLLGRSPVMLDLFRTIEVVAPTDASLLIRGETGTGKELVARVVHALSPRRDMPFVAVNCAAIPEGLVESELFGHERGAFTGAAARRLGRFELAHGGTLFVDEVGDLPLAAQVKVLRVLQERAFERVGGNETIRTDIRLIAATHRDLEQLLDDGAFRRDLFYRLNVVPLDVPPLRERPEDVWLLVEHYSGVIQSRMHKEGISFSPRMREAMEGYHWPGNVRELINVVERAVALTPSGGVADFVSFREGSGSGSRLRAARPWPDPQGGRSLRDLVDAYERQVLEETLARTAGNKTRAAKELGLSRQGLSLKLSKHRM